MKQNVAIVLFIALAGAFLGSFGLYAIPAAERAANQGKYTPLYALANQIRVNDASPQNPPNLRIDSLLRDAPTMVLSDLQGKIHDLKDFRGKLVFLNFWASWCGPCREEWDSMMRLAGAMKGDQFVMLAVSVDEDDTALVDFLKGVRDRAKRTHLARQEPDRQNRWRRSLRVSAQTPGRRHTSSARRARCSIASSDRATGRAARRSTTCALS